MDQIQFLVQLHQQVVAVVEYLASPSPAGAMVDQEEEEVKIKYGSFAGGTGNTPPVSPPQGNNGGMVRSPTAPIEGGGGGGGATTAGANGSW
jgi:hypothetical protein